jgi:hypothetical protein
VITLKLFFSGMYSSAAIILVGCPLSVSTLFDGPLIIVVEGRPA